MSESPRVSVVVPFHNSERTLAACVESLLAQEGVEGGCEILLIDNLSTDASARIAGRYPGVRVLAEPTPGAYAARNAGIERAGAPLIAFTDADCVADADWLRSIVEGMREARTAVLLGHCRYAEEASLPLRWLGAYENAKAEYVIDRCDPAHRFAYCNNMAVRASVFEQLGRFRTWRRAADSELVHRLAARRPDLKLAFCRSMRITHLEFVRLADRARRLALYTRTNSKIATFRELGVGQRLGVMRHLLRSFAPRAYG